MHHPRIKLHLLTVRIELYTSDVSQQPNKTFNNYHANFVMDKNDFLPSVRYWWTPSEVRSVTLTKTLPLENQANFKPSPAADSFFNKCRNQKLIGFSAVLPKSRRHSVMLSTLQCNNYKRASNSGYEIIVSTCVEPPQFTIKDVRPFSLCSTNFITVDSLPAAGSVVGIATAYGLDGPRIESRWGRDFPHRLRPVLRPTQPPVQWVSGLSWG
jgi:hypothetical protein